MTFATLDTQAVDSQLAALPAAVLSRLQAKARDLAQALASQVQDTKLSGQVLQTKTGALKASIAADVTLDGAGLTATVGSFGDVKYAAIQEYGGRTSAHEILPDKAMALAFAVGGVMRFAGRVNHPGSTLPARAYLQSTLAESGDAIVAELASAANAAWEER